MGLIHSIGGSRYAPAFTIDMDNKAEANPEDFDLCNAVDSILTHEQNILNVIESYAGASDEVQRAMKTPTEANEIACFYKLIQNVEKISTIFNYASAIGQVLPPLMDALASGSRINGDINVKRTNGFKELQRKHALARRLIELFSFIIIFDSVRMMRPLVANDFSYYRRMLSRYGKHSQTAAHVRVNDGEADEMATFTRKHNPMFCAVVDALRLAYNDKGKPLVLSGPEPKRIPPTESNIGGGPIVADLLAAVANSCYAILKKRIEAGRAREASSVQTARAMAVCTVVYDHITDLGVYNKRSTVRVKDIIEMLKSDFNFDGTMIALIRYSSKTLSNAPDKIQELLE